MHLANGLAAPCMASVHGIGARCWLGGRGRDLFGVGFGLTCDVIMGWLLHEMDF